MKRFIWLAVIVVIPITVFLLITNYNSHSTLAESVKVNEKEKDFILHVRVEQDEEEIRVLRSLEYLGEEPVVIKHSAPLISVSLDKDIHSFTGSPVEREMEKGEFYPVPQPLLLEEINKENHQLYVKALFSVENQEIVIETNCKLKFE